MVLLAVLISACFLHPAAGDAAEGESSPVVIEKDRGLLDFTNDYIEAEGMGVNPSGANNAQGKALARRAAIVDLQRNLLEFMNGVQVDARTTMENFMADDRVRTELHGIIKNVELLDGEWDGESYTIRGRIRMGRVRVVMAPSLPPPQPYPVCGATPDVTIMLEPEPPAPKAEPAKKPAPQRYTGLVIDVRHLPYAPAMTFQVFDASGRQVYDINNVSMERFNTSGLCAYFNNIEIAKGDLRVTASPIIAKATKLADGNVNIIISNADAAKVRASAPDFRKDCKVIVVSK
jgi:hypothetical protein